LGTATRRHSTNWQIFAEQTGKAAPTNFDAVKEILADEVVKGVIGGTGALEDRRAAAEKIKRASSPQQLNGVLNSWTELLGGQLKGLERQYEGATKRKDFKERFVTPRALEAISATAKSPAATTAAPKNDKGWALMVDAKGNKAYVGPNGEIEEVK
jgi:hypothetical protein